MQPIKVSTNGRYFTWSSGRPFFWLGDTLWELFRCHPLADARQIIAIRKRQGFSVLQVMLTGVGEGDQPNLSGELPWRGLNPLAPNEAWFRQVDAVLELAQRERMIVALGIFHQRQVNTITVQNARRWAAWVAARYGRFPNLVWSMYPRAETGYLPVLRELAAGLRAAEGQRHLITVHPDPAPTSSSFIHAEPWLDFNSLQTCTLLEQIGPMLAADYAVLPTKPAVMAEGGYEGLEFGRLQTPHEIRVQAYWSHLAGGHHSYGHNDCWVAPGEWRRWINAPGAQQLTLYRRLVTGLPRWWQLVPCQELLADGAGECMARAAASRAADGSWALVYLPEARTVRLDLSNLQPGLRARWVNPADGTEVPASQAGPGGRSVYEPPDSWEDALLILR
ncbi:MAG: apiosidase-like domain-containing protein [Anaerolineae bacterium]